MVGYSVVDCDFLLFDVFFEYDWEFDYVGVFEFKCVNVDQYVVFIGFWCGCEFYYYFGIQVVVDLVG